MKKSTALGVDGMNFQLELIGADKQLCIDRRAIKNSHNVEYASVTVEKGKLFVYVNAPQIFRKDNVYPCSIYDLPKLKDAIYKLTCDLQTILSENGIYYSVADSILKKIEVGITSKVVGQCLPSQVQELMNRCVDKVKVYQRNSKTQSCRKENESSFCTREGYYESKVYDKTLQEREEGNIGVEDGLLRIEIVFQGRTIKNMFGEASTFTDVFNEESFVKVMEKFCEVFSEKIIKGQIKPFLTKARNELFEYLSETDSPTETLARHRDIILDEEILRKALKRWYELRGRPDNSRQTIYDLRKYDLPKDVLKTIKKFHKLCL